MLQNARDLRARRTDAEAKLWALLRNRRIFRVKFRRQHPIDRYILDFFCCEAKLAIEVDGGEHLEARQAAYDAERSETLGRSKIRVLRFFNDEVLREPEGVYERIRQALEEKGVPRPNPLPPGEGA